MTKAVALSALLHLFVLLLMNFFLYELPVAEVFPVIRVQLAPLIPAGGGSDAAVVSMSEALVDEQPSPVVPPRETASPEPSRQPERPVPAAELETPDEPVYIPAGNPVQTPAAVLEHMPVEEDVPVEEGMPEEAPAETPDISTPDVIAEEDSVQPDTPSGAAAVAEQYSESTVQAAREESSGSDQAVIASDGGVLPDVRWEGGAAFARYVPEPDFNIPIGSNPPDVISVSFRVASDGTVVSANVLTYTGSLALDSEIRRYVTSFLFESFDSGDDVKNGVLTLTLKAGGGTGW